MSTWIQCSIWRQKWPHHAINDILPAIRTQIVEPRKIRWHFLYEPNLLVRIETADVSVVTELQQLADFYRYKFKEGDTSKSPLDITGDVFFFGDIGIYGTALWEANADVLHANANLVVCMEEQKQRNPKMFRKHVHLLCNQFGKNYLQECLFLLRHAARAFRLFLKYGFN